METNEIVIMCQIATVVIMTISMVVAIISLVCSQKALSKELKEANKRMMTQLEHRFTNKTSTRVVFCRIYKTISRYYPSHA